MLSREERLEKMVNLLTDDVKKLIMKEKKLNNYSDLVTFMNRFHMVISEDLFNMIHINTDVTKADEFVKLLCSFDDWTYDFFSKENCTIDEYRNRMIYCPVDMIVIEGMDSNQHNAAIQLISNGNTLAYKALLNSNMYNVRL